MTSNLSHSNCTFPGQGSIPHYIRIKTVRLNGGAKDGLSHDRMIQIFQKTSGILGLEEIPVIKTVTIVQYLLNPLCRDISRPFIRTAAYKDKVAFTQIHFQFLQLQTQGRQEKFTSHKTI